MEDNHDYPCYNTWSFSGQLWHHCDTTPLGLLSFVVDTKCTNNFWIKLCKYPCNGSGYVCYQQCFQLDMDVLLQLFSIWMITYSYSNFDNHFYVLRNSNGLSIFTNSYNHSGYWHWCILAMCSLIMAKVIYNHIFMVWFLNTKHTFTSRKRISGW